MINQSDVELAYLAGIIDADGTVNIYRGGKRPRKDYNARLYVVSTDKVLVDWLQEHFGGLVYYRKSTNPKWKDKYEWIAERRLMDKLASAILPYIVIKHPQLELAIKFRQSFHRPAGKLSPEVREFREGCFQQMKLLNSRRKKRQSC